MSLHRPGDLLFVNADTSFLIAVRPLLTQQGYAITHCGSLAEARRLWQRTTYDAVICDDLLPDGAGIQFCRFVKSAQETAHISFALLLKEIAESDWEDLAYARIDADALKPKDIDLFHDEDVNASTVPDALLTRSMSAFEILAHIQEMLNLQRQRHEIDNSLQALMALAEGNEEEDWRNSGHCKRLTMMGIELSQALGYNEDQMMALERAAYLHDIGTIRTQGALRAKPEPLSPRETQMMQTHPVVGERLCYHVEALRTTLPIIRSHHERRNGTGYPDGLRDDKIPLLAQTFSILDVYEVMRSWRPYRPPMTQEQAILMMRDEVKNGFWNRDIFETFVSRVLPDLDARLSAARLLWAEL